MEIEDSRLKVVCTPDSREKKRQQQSCLLLAAIGEELQERDREVERVKREADLKLAHVWHQLVFLQGSLTKERVRLGEILQDKENIIQSQRQEIQQLRNSVLRQKEKLEKKPSEEKKYSEEKKPELRNSGCQTHGRGGSFRRQKRERPTQASSSTDESSPGCTPRQARHPGEGEATSLARGGLKFTKSSERPKVRLEQRKSPGSENRLILKSGDEELGGNVEEEETTRGILKSRSRLSKPPVPSRSRVNAVLGVGVRCRDSGNSSLDSSDPSSSLEWKLSVRSTIPARRSEESQRAPPPPPRRSKSYERPQQDPDEGGFSNYFEEYDLAHMDVDSSTMKGKRVSFEGEQTATSLKKLASVPILSQIDDKTNIFGMSSEASNCDSAGDFQIIRGRLDSFSVLSQLLSESNLHPESSACPLPPEDKFYF